MLPTLHLHAPSPPHRRNNAALYDATVAGAHGAQRRDDDDNEDERRQRPQQPPLQRYVHSGTATTMTPTGHLRAAQPLPVLPALFQAKWETFLRRHNSLQHMLHSPPATMATATTTTATTTATPRRPRGRLPSLSAATDAAATALVSREAVYARQQLTLMHSEAAQRQRLTAQQENAMTQLTIEGMREMQHVLLLLHTRVRASRALRALPPSASPAATYTPVEPSAHDDGDAPDVHHRPTLPARVQPPPSSTPTPTPCSHNEPSCGRRVPHEHAQRRPRTDRPSLSVQYAAALRQRSYALPASLTSPPTTPRRHKVVPTVCTTTATATTATTATLASNVHALLDAEARGRASLQSCASAEWAAVMAQCVDDAHTAMQRTRERVAAWQAAEAAGLVDDALGHVLCTRAALCEAAKGATEGAANTTRAAFPALDGLMGALLARQAGRTLRNDAWRALAAAMCTAAVERHMHAGEAARQLVEGREA